MREKRSSTLKAAAFEYQEANLEVIEVILGREDREARFPSKKSSEEHWRGRLRCQEYETAVGGADKTHDTKY